MKLYISTDGNDNAAGSKEAPIKTLEEAKRRIHSEKEKAEVFLKGGRYHFDQTFELTDIKDREITFQAYDDEAVYFDGGILLDWKKVRPLSDERIKNRIIDSEAREKVMEIDLSAYELDYAEYGTRGFRRAYVPAPNELFINSEPYDIARYPNVGEKLIPLKNVLDGGSVPYHQEFDLRPAVFVCEDERCELWGAAKDFCLQLHP